SLPCPPRPLPRAPRRRRLRRGMRTRHDVLAPHTSAALRHDDGWSDGSEIDAPSGDASRGGTQRPAPTVLLVAAHGAFRAAAALAFAYDRLRIAEATDVESALESLRVSTPDVIVADGKLPDASGGALVAIMQRDERLARIPVVILSVDDDEV